MDKSKKSGGGVLIAVSMKLPSEQIEFSALGIEFLAVKIRLGSCSLFLTCSYIPPSSHLHVYNNHVSAINSTFHPAKSSDILIALGDFNLPLIKWNPFIDSNYLVPVFGSGSVNECIESLLVNGLFQVNNVYNSFGKLLDLIFVNQPKETFLMSTDALVLPEDRFHPTIELKINLYPSLTSTSEKIKKLKEFCFIKTDYLKLNSLLSSVDWNGILSSNNLENVIENFYIALHFCISKCVPLLAKYDNVGPPWNTCQLTRIKNRKNKLYKKYKKSGSSTDYCVYSIARSEYNMENKRAYNLYLNRTKDQLKSNPKLFYRFVNSKRKSHIYPKSFKFNSVVNDDDVGISNMFADFFQSTYSNNLYDHKTEYPYTIPKSVGINVSPISAKTVLENLKALKISFVPGPDGVPANILKHTANVLSHPLSVIFNKSLSLGYLPPLWKQSYIIPLHKSGSKSEVSNYRGIAKLSNIPKLLEKILTDSISHQISTLLSPCQHGFRKSRSTITNVLEFTTKISDGFMNKMQTDAIYTDFSKAFDKVNHSLLFFKLDSMGFSDKLVYWLKSYLTGRIQKVKFGNALSNEIFVYSGVPQGSHIGPILFTLFINDLPTVVQYASILMYADDVKIFKSFNDEYEQNFLQTDLNNFYRWCQINLMDLNISKCKHMSFFRQRSLSTTYSFGGHKLISVDTFLDLGILLDQRLNFRQHISLTVNKAYGALGFMKRWSKEFSDPLVTKRLYTSLVRCILEYGSIIWNPVYNIHINLIESVQKQFLLFCLRGHGWNPHTLPSYESRLEMIKLPTLKSRRTMLSIMFLYNILKGNSISEFITDRIQFNVPSRPTRNFQLLNIPYFRSNYANNDPLRQICFHFNANYHIIDLSENRSSLKKKITLYLNN